MTLLLAASVGGVQARHFASQQARFISPDPVIINAQKMTNPQSLNLYSYVNNNPLRFVDPDGRLPADFYDEKGKKLGTDGNSDGRAYIVTDKTEATAIKNADKSGGTTPVGGVSSAVAVPDNQVRSAIGAAVAASNAADPSVGDTKGGFHETGGLAGPTITATGPNGPQKIVPAAPGAAGDPATGGVAIDLFKHANPSDTGTFLPTTSWHVHPKGVTYTYTAKNTVEHSFNQGPAGNDTTFAATYPGITTNIVVGARNNTVTFFNAGGNVATFPLNKLLALP